jgi:hypothetical protein
VACSEEFYASFRKLETGHQIENHNDSFGAKLTEALRPVRCVHDGDKRINVGVIHECGRQDGASMVSISHPLPLM